MTSARVELSSSSSNEQGEQEYKAPAVKLAKLTNKHKEALSLVAQGLSRREIGSVVGFATDYISWLCRQEVSKQYLQEMMDVVEFRVQSMTLDSVDTIADVMKCGTSDERLKAAKLQLEVVGRVGAGKNQGQTATVAPDHLKTLADRLVGMLRASKEGVTYDGKAQEVEDVVLASTGARSEDPQQLYQPGA